MVQVRQISASETIPVRQPVLRKGLPVETCFFDGDELSTTVHFGVFEDENLVGVATLLDNSKDIFEGKQLQLRGMAVLENVQGKGIGKILLEAGENYAKSRFFDLIWFNARTSAQSFYAKNGYLVMGEEFQIPGVGPHVVMYKKLV